MGGTGASLLQGAATITKNNSTSAATFANNWAGYNTWQNEFFMGSGNSGNYNPDRIDEAQNNNDIELVNRAVANAAVIKARNTSFATFLRDNPQYGDGIGTEIYDDLANYTYSGSSIPQDATANPRNVAKALKDKNGKDNDYAQRIMTAINAASTDYYGTGEDRSNTQAYKDALAYYAMMETIDTVNVSNPDDETYWNEMKTGVSLYGSIARGEISTTDLNSTFDAIFSDGVVCAFRVQDNKIIASGVLYSEDK